MFLRVMGDLQTHEPHSVTAICELSNKCVSLDVSQHLGPPQPVTKMALLFTAVMKTAVCDTV
jgi:hypothetical protein